MILLAASGLVVLVAAAVLAAQLGGKASPGSGGVDLAAHEPLLIAGVEVREPWTDHGVVPLDTPVAHEWLLRNTGTQTVSLGQASIETLEGC